MKYIRKFSLIISGILLLTCVYAQKEAKLSEIGILSSTHDIYLGNQGFHMYNNNLYLVGYFSDSVDFDPGPGTSLLISQGVNIYIAKYDNNLKFKWVKHIKGSFLSYKLAVSMDQNGSIYIVGKPFDNTADYDPGPGVYNISFKYPSGDFAAKYDSNGNLLWAKAINGNFANTYNIIKADNSGNIYFAGNFTDSVDCDPSINKATLYSRGKTDWFLAKYNPNFNLLWIKQFGGKGTDQEVDMDLDEKGNIHLTGYINDSCDFDPGPGSVAFTRRYYLFDDIFTAKYNSNGNYIFARSITGTQKSISSIQVHKGKVFLTGTICADIHFVKFNDPYSNLNSKGDHDFFIAKYDTAYNFIWARSIESDMGQIDALNFDKNDEILIQGTMSSKTIFDINKPPLQVIGKPDYFFGKYDTAGYYKWVKRITGNGSQNYTTNVFSDNSGDIIVAVQSAYGVVDLNPGADTLNYYINKFKYVVFLEKFSTCLADFDAYPVYTTLCENESTLFSVDAINAANYQWQLSKDKKLWNNINDGSNYTGTKSDKLKIAPIYYSNNGDYYRCVINGLCTSKDTSFPAKLTVIPKTVFAYEPTDTGICLGSKAYFRVSLPNSSNFSIYWEVDTGTGFKKITYSNQLYSGCNSKVLTIKYPLIKYNGYQYRSLLIPQYSGCPPGDTSKSVILHVSTVDTSIILNGKTLISNDSDASYQWIDCKNGYSIIPGETNKKFIPSKNGNYAVIVSNNGCIDTSSCRNINAVFIGNQLNRKILVYPNPVNDVLFIEGLNQNFNISLSDINGKIIFLPSISNSTMLSSYNIKHLSSGVYILKLTNTENGEYRYLKFLKK